MYTFYMHHAGVGEHRPHNSTLDEAEFHFCAPEYRLSHISNAGYIVPPAS
jgi:hypothetical protein